MDTLQRLWTSSAEFHARFDQYPPDTDAQLRCMFEEAFEVAHAALTSDDLIQVGKEGADLIVTLMGVLMSRGVPLEMLEDAMLFVAAKNDAKTAATHAVNTAGKIAKISRRG